jgi:BTB/POZ domain
VDKFETILIRAEGCKPVSRFSQNDEAPAMKTKTIRIDRNQLLLPQANDDGDCFFKSNIISYTCEMKRFSTSWSIGAKTHFDTLTKTLTSFQVTLHQSKYSNHSDSSIPHSFAAAIAIKNSPHRKISRRGSGCVVLEVPPSLLLLDPGNEMFSGSDHFVVKVRLWEQGGPVWFPQLVGDPDLAQLYTNPVWADVTFLVEGKSFPAHKNILSIKAPALLLDLKETNEPIELTGIDSNTFDMLSCFIYTTSVPVVKDFSEAKAALTAADRFAVQPLKLSLESNIVDALLDKLNAVEFLLLADALSCAQLKEFAMAQIQSRPEEAMAAERWADVVKSNSLMEEMLKAAYFKDEGPNQRAKNNNNKRVAELRNELTVQGLDVDGTRETLLKRLKLCQ